MSVLSDELRRLASINRTFLPSMATDNAKLDATKVLPSPFITDVTVATLCSMSLSIALNTIERKSLMSSSTVSVCPVKSRGLHDECMSM